MAVNQIIYRLQDDESDVKFAPFVFYVPTGFTLAQYQSFADVATPVVDAVSESKIVSIDLNLGLAINGAGLKGSPVASALNERGGLLGMSNAGQFNDSVRIPAIQHTIMSGDEFSIADADINDLITVLVAGDTVVIPRTRDGFTWTAALYGKKSFRRK